MFIILLLLKYGIFIVLLPYKSFQGSLYPNFSFISLYFLLKYNNIINNNNNITIIIINNVINIFFFLLVFVLRFFVSIFSILKKFLFYIFLYDYNILFIKD